MEMHDIDPLLEKMCDLHDKLSDAIHSISRSHFLRTTSDDVSLPRKNGFVFVKNFPAEDKYEAAVSEAKSLDAIRAALENFEDQLEFFQTVQVQQRAERDAAMARIEQSRIFLALRLSEHEGKKYKFIEEALNFVSNTAQLVSTNYTSASYPLGEKPCTRKGVSFNIIKVMVSSFDFVKKSLNIYEMRGVLGNAALVALGMLTFLHFHQTGSEDKWLPLQHNFAFYNRNTSTNYLLEESSSSDRLDHLDVTLAKG